MEASGKNDDVLTEEKVVKKKELDKHTTKVYDKKDRAQVTAASAQSVGLIAILKNMLHGPKNTPFFAINTVLVCTAIAIQIIIGVLCIMMTRTKKQTTDLIDKIQKSQTTYKTKTSTDEDQPPKYGAMAASASTPGTGGYPNIPDYAVGASSSRSHAICVCCPSWCRDNSLDSVEAMHDEFLHQLHEQTKQLNNAEANLVNTDHSNKEQLTAAEDEVERRKAMVRLTLSKLRQNSYAEQLVAKKAALHEADRLQTVITYMQYCTFVINGFIVAFANME